MSLLDDLGDVLACGGLGTVGSTLYKSTMPSFPDEVVALFETGGAPPVRAMASAPGLALAERPHVQVRTRAAHPATAKQSAQSAVRLLDGLRRTINGVPYRAVYALQAPFFLQTDATGRAEYAVNFEIVKDLATSS